MDESQRLLGGLSPQVFLDQYWQKKPLLISGALPGFASPMSAGELAGLACEENVESRLIIEEGGDHPWQLRHGPFCERDFTTLPASHWTLLVQEVDKHVAEAAELKERFRFIPDWRIDDVMVSFAPAHGSVGPHEDSYDVFLVQAAGRRRWAVDARPERESDLLPGLDLRVLARFEPQQTWVLEPGDMLYLPPGVAHHGVALEDCQTWSVGFHAPSHTDLLTAMADHLAAGIDPQARYGDSDLTVQTNPGEISPRVLEKVESLVRDLVRGADAAEWFGCLVTESRSGLTPQRPEAPLTQERFKVCFQERGVLHRDSATRFAFVSRKEGAMLFVDGDAYRLPPPLAYVAPLLCRSPSVGYHELQSALADGDLLTTLLADLYNQGNVRFLD